MDAVTLSSGSEENAFAVLLHVLLSDCAARHGDRLPGLLGCRLGLIARDAGAEATLYLEPDGSCVVAGGIDDADLIIETDSDLLARLQALPVRFGVPWLLSSAGAELLLSLVQQRPRLRGIVGAITHPQRALRALWDAHRLSHLLAGA